MGSWESGLAHAANLESVPPVSLRTGAEGISRARRRRPIRTALALALDPLPSAVPRLCRHRGELAGMWDSVNGERGFGWAANPWLWADRLQARRGRPEQGGMTTRWLVIAQAVVVVAFGVTLLRHSRGRRG